MTYIHRVLGLLSFNRHIDLGEAQLMFSFFKKNQLIKSFAEELAAELYSSVPPEVVKEYQKTKSKKASSQFAKAVDNSVLRLAQFKEINKLGVYGKAKFHQLFLDKLQVLGYDKELAKEINRILLVKTP